MTSAPLIKASIVISPGGRHSGSRSSGIVTMPAIT
jgi:hypothetical protein